MRRRAGVLAPHTLAWLPTLYPQLTPSFLCWTCRGKRFIVRLEPAKYLYLGV